MCQAQGLKRLKTILMRFGNLLKVVVQEYHGPFSRKAVPLLGYCRVEERLQFLS